MRKFAPAKDDSWILNRWFINDSWIHLSCQHVLPPPQRMHVSMESISPYNGNSWLIRFHEASSNALKWFGLKDALESRRPILTRVIQPGEAIFSCLSHVFLIAWWSIEVGWESPQWNLVASEEMRGRDWGPEPKHVISTWNLKHLFINGCFNWMVPDLYLGNGCFTKHPFKTGCLGYQV